MTDKPTPKEIENLFVEETGFDIDDFPAAIFDFARAVLAKWGTPAPVGVGEVAERYRNAIASACEGWTMPDGLRKHLETALWSLPTHAQAGAVPLTDEQMRTMRKKHPAEDLCGWSYRMGIADAETHHGITQKGGSNGL